MNSARRRWLRVLLGMIALVAAIAPVVPGFLNAATTPGGQVSNPTFLDHLYTYAWFVTFALGFVIYYALTRGSKGDSLNATHG